MLVVLITLFLLFDQTKSQQQCSCGIENQSARVIGGSTVSENKYPWMASLVLSSAQGTMMCGGAIINDRYILTAAHCVEGVSLVRYAVGTNRLVPEQSLKVALQYIKHESYNDLNKHNDIALIKLREPLQFSRNVRPICLPTATHQISGPLTVAGWGQTEWGRPSERLLEATVTEYDWNRCNAEWGNSLIRSQFCAAEYGKASCMGDSGGPLISRNRGKATVVGVVSFGLRECGVARNAVYTKVSMFLDWIQRNTRDGIACAN